MLVFILNTEAQEKPPRPITVTVSLAQQLRFGSFIQTGNNTETIKVDYTGMRSSSLGIITVSSLFTPALFIVDAEPGTLIRLVCPNATLSGSNGGKLDLELGDASTGSPFITRSQTTDVYIGGTLTVLSLSANPAGFYSGTFQVIFIQE